MTCSDTFGRSADQTIELSLLFRRAHIGATHWRTGLHTLGRWPQFARRTRGLEAPRTASALRAGGRWRLRAHPGRARGMRGRDGFVPLRSGRRIRRTWPAPLGVERLPRRGFHADGRFCPGVAAPILRRTETTVHSDLQGPARQLISSLDLTSSRRRSRARRSPCREAGGSRTRRGPVRRAPGWGPPERDHPSRCNRTPGCSSRRSAERIRRDAHARWARSIAAAHCPVVERIWAVTQSA